MSDVQLPLMTRKEVDALLSENPNARVVTGDEAMKMLAEMSEDGKEPENKNISVVIIPARPKWEKFDGLSVEKMLPQVWDTVETMVDAEILPDEPFPYSGGYKGGRAKRRSSSSDQVAAFKRKEKNREKTKNAKKVKKAQRKGK